MNELTKKDYCKMMYYFDLLETDYKEKLENDVDDAEKQSINGQLAYLQKLKIHCQKEIDARHE